MDYIKIAKYTVRALREPRCEVCPEQAVCESNPFPCLNKQAAKVIETLMTEIERMRIDFRPERYAGESGTMPNFTAHWFVCDFELCSDVEALKQTLAKINRYGFDVVSVTQDAAGTYTVFFRRLAA